MIVVLVHVSTLPLYHHLFCRCALALVAPLSSFALSLLDLFSGRSVRKQRPGNLAVATAVSARVGSVTSFIGVLERNKIHGSCDVLISCIHCCLSTAESVSQRITIAPCCCPRNVIEPRPACSKKGGAVTRVPPTSRVAWHICCRLRRILHVGDGTSRCSKASCSSASCCRALASSCLSSTHCFWCLR